MLLERTLNLIASEAMQSALDLPEAPAALLRPTQDAKFGDYQVNGAMALAKQLGKKPRDLAEPIAAKLLEHEAVEAAEVAGPGFINLRISAAWLGRALDAMYADRERDGVDTVDTAEHVVVDYSSPNIAKQMHVGHLRSTIIGHALVKLLRFVGHRVTSVNHLGDWGTQFGLLIVGMREWGSQDALDQDAIVELGRVYALASARSKTDEAFAESARAELAKLQNGDPENTALWKRFVAATRKTLDVVYGQLGVTFDEWLGESFYHDRLQGVVDLLQEKGLAREDEGALCVFWNELPTPSKGLEKQKEPFIVRKRDGAFLYSTTDMAAVLYRRDVMKADRVLDVVGTPQALHFKQVFGLSQLLGVTTRMEHIAFGSVLGEDQKPIRSRDGVEVTLQGLLSEAVERARARIQEGMDEGRLKIDPADLDDTATKLGIGAVKYADLRQNRVSDYVFDWDKMISFQGNAGPYMQNAYVRCRSIFRKGEVDPDQLAGAVTLVTEEEQALARLIARFGDVVHQAAETSQPNYLCEHLFELSKAFSRFYEVCPVLNADDADARASRLRLTALVSRQLGRGLTLLGIDVVERM
ncbi:MAG: arginine--tRNA ligase [Sandaracinaceae bacterium]|nr:arginine--tRNA ligase [Sandaracinaceae bacterium]